MSTWSLSLGLGRGPAEQEEGGSLVTSSASVVQVVFFFCVCRICACSWLAIPQVDTPQCGGYHKRQGMTPDR